MPISGIFASLSNLAGSLWKNRQLRKAAKEAALAKLTQGQQDQTHALALSKDEWETLNVASMGETWKDEYVTVSVVSIFNLILLGGVLAAFGYPQVLTGVGAALAAMVAAGVDVGFLMNATIMAGLGLSVWKRF